MDDDLLNDFLEESYDLIDKVKATLSSWDDSKEDKEGLNSIYRWVHTIKGGASVFSYKETTKLAHDLESYMGNLRKAGDRIDEQSRKKVLMDISRIEASLKGEDFSHAEDSFEELTENTSPVFTTRYFEEFFTESEGLLADMAGDGFLFFELLLPSDLIEKLTDKLTQHDILPLQTLDKGDKTACLCSIQISQKPELRKKAEDLITRFEGGWCLLSREEDISEEPPVELKRPETMKHAAPGPAVQAQEVLRVPLATVNSILDHVWELFLVRNQMSHFFQANKELFKDHYTFVQQFEFFDSVLERNIHEIESKTMSLRLSPVKKIFDRMEKVVSEYCHQTGKKIHFTTRGEGIDLDKKVLDQLNEPLIHLIRNAIDHGIEDTEERKKHSKSETGSVELSAQLQGNEVLITIKDDGKGIDPERILASARKKNLDVDHLNSEQEIVNLIFAPGFSTAEKVTDVSGRGVGMDAVKTSINELGGHVTLETKVGKGTCFKISLPLTMSVSKSLIVKIGGLEYAIPTKSIIFVEKVSVHDLKLNGPDQFYQFNNNLIQCYDMRSVLPDYRSEPDLPVTHTHVCVTSFQGKEIAFRVDEIVQTLNLVMKPMPKVSRKHPFLAGVSIMPGGNPVFVLNVGECILNLSDKRGNNGKRVA